MGWDFTQGAKRKDIIERQVRVRHLLNDAGTMTCLRHCTRGNVLWTVWKHASTEKTETFIGCDLLQKSRFGWGYKSMEESMSPFYYTCPLAYLRMAPVANREWREKVRAYHAKQKQQRARKFTLGETVELKGVTIPWVIITSLKPLHGRHGRKTYRIPRSILA